MKKLLMLIALIFAFVACKETQMAKIYECTNFSLDCELQKDRILVLPITFDSTLIDAYGNKIEGELINSQWYIISTKIRALAPITIRVCIGGDINTGPWYTGCPSPQTIIDHGWERGNIRIDTTDLSAIIPGLTKAVIIVSGPNEIKTGSDGAELALAKK